jgi:hypothetical protein
VVFQKAEHYFLGQIIFVVAFLIFQLVFWAVGLAENFSQKEGQSYQHIFIRFEKRYGRRVTSLKYREQDDRGVKGKEQDDR